MEHQLSTISSDFIINGELLSILTPICFQYYTIYFHTHEAVTSQLSLLLILNYHYNQDCKRQYDNNKLLLHLITAVMAILSIEIVADASQLKRHLLI